MLTRADLFALAIDLDTDGALLRLLWHVLAWGTGPRPRNQRRLLASIANGGTPLIAVLREAADMARHDPEGAYALLRPSRRNAAPAFGPAFFTKFLYFAGRGCYNHPSLILDRRVAATLHHEAGWTSLSPTHGWPAATYGRYCRLVTRWAVTETVCRHRVVCPDEIEH
jgi:hypothetical protein